MYHCSRNPEGKPQHYELLIPNKQYLQTKYKQLLDAEYKTASELLQKLDIKKDMDFAVTLHMKEQEDELIKQQKKAIDEEESLKLIKKMQEMEWHKKYKHKYLSLKKN